MLSGCAPVAALRLCGVFNAQQPLVLSAIFSSLQNHFRVVKRKAKRWPGVEGRFGEKTNNLSTRCKVYLHTI